jgi:hypothetical protein
MSYYIRYYIRMCEVQSYCEKVIRRIRVKKSGKFREHSVCRHQCLIQIFLKLRKLGEGGLLEGLIYMISWLAAHFFEN